MSVDRCPTQEELTQYTLGILDTEAVSELERHLESCTECAETLELLETKSDLLTNLLRSPAISASDEFFREDLCRESIAEVTRLMLSQEGLHEIARTALTARDRSGVVPEAGQRLGQFLLLEMVGRGGMGLVFKALHEKLDKVFALKVLSATRMFDPRMRERFHREMQAAGRIEHPHVVRAIYSDESNGVPYLVMEFVDGINLSALLKSQGPFSQEIACELIRQAGLGLLQIHQAGMVHRDLKPGNLMISQEGQVKVMDLGLALLHEHVADGSDGLTLSGQVMGTVDYMAPEQADDTHGVDARADIYGLGATLFALLTGRTPLGNKQQTLLKKLSLLATQPMPSLREFLPDAPDELVATVDRMLARDPAQRFANVQDAIAALTPFSNGEQLQTLLLEGIAFEKTSEQRDIDSDQETMVLQRQTQKPLPFAEQPLNNPDVDDHGVLIAPQRRLRLTRWFVIFVGLVGTTMLVWGYQKGLFNKADLRLDGATEIRPRTTSSVEVASSGCTAETPLQELAMLVKAAGSEEIPEGSLEIFSKETPPDLRANAIHAACHELPVSCLLEVLQGKLKPSVRAGLLLALSEYEKEDIYQACRGNGQDESDFLNSLFFDYVNESDPEVHACLGYLLRCWEQHEMLRKLRPLLEQKLTPFEGGWYQPLHVSEMVVVPGPAEARLGSPSTEPGRNSAPEQIEDLRTVVIPYTFAICSTEVTQYQLWRTSDRYWDIPSPESPEAPLNNVPWRSAAAFCNRLSELEGIPPAEHCYYAIEGSGGLTWRQKENALELTGYRLPTDDEWEVACRAGTSSIRPFGNDPKWLGEYVRGERPAGERLNVGSLKPNSLGLFDMLGNVAEWIHSDPSSISTEKGVRRARGGSAWTPAAGLRSAARYVFENTSPKVGFRVARTLIPRPYKNPNSTARVSEIEIEVGPPACPEELAQFVDQRFLPLRDEQVVSLGNWNVHDVPTRKFRIRNPTDKDIDLAHRPWMNDYFEFAPAPPDVISAGGAFEFGIRMNVRGVGERLHDLHFQWGQLTSVDRREFDFSPIRLHGCFEGALLEVMGVGQFGSAAKSIDLGTVPVGSVAGKTFFVINVGDKAVEAEVVDISGPFSVSSPLDGFIVPHKIEKTFRVGFDSSVPGSHEGHVRLRTREKNPTEFTFPLRVIVSELDGFSSLGVFGNGTWLLDHNRDGRTDEEIVFGMSDDRPLTGDWNGDGLCDLGVWRRNSEGRIQIERKLRGQEATPLETAEILIPPDAIKPVAADRDGDGRAEIGYLLSVPERNTMVWRFDTAHDGEYSDRVAFGQPDDDTIIGDWNGDGLDDIAVSRPGLLIAPGARVWQMTWKGLAVPRELIYLSPYDFPLAGDWDADGDDDPGGWRPVADPGLSVWQFESDGDGVSNNELEGFGSFTDTPVVLRNRSK